MELKAISGREIREDIDYNTKGVDLEDKEWRKYGKELCDTLYYRKSEADQYILELQVKLNQTENLLNKALDCISKSNKHIQSLARKVCYNKYRRCLNMVKWCRDYREGLSDDKMPWEKVHRLYVLYGKWMNRWKELAELFKRVLHV